MPWSPPQSLGMAEICKHRGFGATGKTCKNHAKPCLPSDAPHERLRRNWITNGFWHYFSRELYVFDPLWAVLDWLGKLR